MERTSNYQDLPELHKYKHRFRKDGIAFVWCSRESPLGNSYETSEMFREQLKSDIKAYDKHGTIFNPGATILELARIAASGKFKDNQPCYQIVLLVDGYEPGQSSHATVIAKCIRFFEKRIRTIGNTCLMKED